MMTIHGGSIESYEIGIDMGLGVSVACFGVYFETDKEGLAGDDKGATCFEALVEGLRGDGQAGEVEPEEDGAFGLVDKQALFQAA